jgi:hypothetical protein
MMCMTWIAPPVERPDPDYVASERDALEQWLRFQRDTLLGKCSGLDGDQLCRRAVEPSTLSLLGLVRHMRDVERSWFLRGFTGLDKPPIYYSDENRDGDFDDTDPARAEQDLADFSAECADADAAVASRELDETYTSAKSGHRIDLRWIYVHMIEEYARHNGHADLIRERIDGVVGD